MKKYATVDNPKSVRILTSALTWFFLRTVPSSRNAKPACIASTMIAPSRMKSVSALVRSASIDFRPPCDWRPPPPPRLPLKREVKLRQKRAGKRHARERTRAVRARLEQQFALGRERLEVVAEHAVERVVETQHVHGCDHLSVLDPERSEAR